MAKYVTRTSKFTEARITVFNTTEKGLIERYTFINGWYKSFEKGSDGWKAIQEDNTLGATEILVLVNEFTNRTEKRRMSMADWLYYSESCDGTEEDTEEATEE